MQIALFGKSLPDENIRYIQQIIKGLEMNNVGIVFYEKLYNIVKDKVVLKNAIRVFNTHEEIKDTVSYLFSIGGDGTLLDTLSYIRDSGIPVLGINLGRMGFISSISKERIDSAINQLVNNKFKLDKRTLINIKTSEDIFGDLNYALNEVSFYRKSPLTMLKIQAFVDDDFVNSYWADGLIISTPTGSTAYSLSNGGPIILPGSQNFVITPIATHNLTVRPIVIPDSSKIRIKVASRVKDFYVNLDSRSVQVNSSYEFVIKREEFKINLLQLEDESYFRTIREKLLWGLDIRN
jgi:NAD+ kinase